VAEFVIIALAGLLALFLWLMLVTLIVRPFGVRLPIAPLSFAKRKVAVRDLTFSQHFIVFGILYFGFGMFIVTTLSRYIEWKYFHGSSDGLSTNNLLLQFVTYPLVSGSLFGLFTWNGRSSAK
jgi:hypothetical protein